MKIEFKNNQEKEFNTLNSVKIEGTFVEFCHR